MPRQRVLIKLSGAALKNKCPKNIDDNFLIAFAKQIKELHKKYDIAIVIGGGNIWRGRDSNLKLYEEETSHYLGMVGTIINSVAMQQALLKAKVPTIVYTLLPCPKVVPTYEPKKANASLAKKNIVILAGGTGKPFFSTDTGAAINATELKINIIAMAKDGVDGVYSADPKINKKAIRYEQLTFDQVIKQKLNVMDMSAIEICKKSNIDILVFNAQRKDCVIAALDKKIPITTITNKKIVK